MGEVIGGARPLRYYYSEGMHKNYKYCFASDDGSADKIAAGWKPTAKHIYEVQRWCEDQFGERGYRWGEVRVGYESIIVFVDAADATAFRLRWC